MSITFLIWPLFLHLVLRLRRLEFARLVGLLAKDSGVAPDHVDSFGGGLYLYPRFSKSPWLLLVLRPLIPLILSVVLTSSSPNGNDADDLDGVRARPSSSSYFAYGNL